MDAHERYEQLAVGHVLGGLDAGEAADFRSHLLGCRDCRLRVAELRDIAADLAAAEREERAHARLRTEVEQRTAEASEEPPPRPGVSSRVLAGVAVSAVVVFGLLAFWNLHLRTQVAAFERHSQLQDATLSELASGVPVTVESTPPATGLVVIDERTVAFSVTDLPSLAYDERYVVWVTGGADGPRSVPVAPTRAGPLFGTGELGDARALVVTVETTSNVGDAPAGREVARADLVPD